MYIIIHKSRSNGNAQEIQSVLDIAPVVIYMNCVTLKPHYISNAYNFLTRTLIINCKMDVQPLQHQFMKILFFN